jgi:hypothetical protein
VRARIAEKYVDEENPVRVIEVFIDELDLAALGFSGMTLAATGRPAYHPSTLLKIYLYGYLTMAVSCCCAGPTIVSSQRRTTRSRCWLAAGREVRLINPRLGEVLPLWWTPATTGCP